MSDNNVALSNEEVISTLKNVLINNVSRQQYEFKLDEPRSELRCPNEKEKKDYLLNVLRNYRSWPDTRQLVDTNRYRSIKGEIKKGHFENVFNFFRNLGHPDVRKNFDQYCASETIMDITVHVTVPVPVQICTIEIDVNKGGN